MTVTYAWIFIEELRFAVLQPRVDHAAVHIVLDLYENIFLFTYMLYALCFMHYALCIMLYALCFTHYALRIMLYAHALKLTHTFY